MLDLLIKNARIVDGAGTPWFRGSVGVKDGKIAFAGAVPEGTKAARVIDAGDHVVSPGFIDCHAHYEFAVLVTPDTPMNLAQGVTTNIIGMCGIGAAPAPAERRDEINRYCGFIQVGVTPDYRWTSFGEYLDALASLPLGANTAVNVGQGAVRLATMGFEPGTPTEKQLQQMESYIDEAFSSGAFAMSLGLIYPPGLFSQEPELQRMGKVVARHGGFVVSHVRDEGTYLIPSVEELIRLGRAADIPVQLHHWKATGRKNWGHVKNVAKLIEDARAEGLDVTADQYPYVASCTNMRAVLPPWMSEGGIALLCRRLRDPETRARAKHDVLHNNGTWQNYLEDCGGPDGILVVSAPAQPQCQGKTLTEAGRILGEDPVDALFDIIRDNDGRDLGAYFSMCEDDVCYVMQKPYVMIGSDTIPGAPGIPCHPRAAGTFVRVLGHYAREEGLLSLEEAVRKMTGLPAARYGLAHKGLIRPGMDADLCVFDPDTVNAASDYEHTDAKPVGVDYVVVNGTVAVERGEFTGARAGRVLRRGKA